MILIMQQIIKFLLKSKHVFNQVSSDLGEVNSFWVRKYLQIFWIPFYQNL